MFGFGFKCLFSGYGSGLKEVIPVTLTEEQKSKIKWAKETDAYLAWQYGVSLEEIKQVRQGS